MMKRLLAIVLSVVMLCGTAPAALVGYAAAGGQSSTGSTAAATDSRYAETIQGTFKYASNESGIGDVLGEGTFRYSDRWFTGSGYDVNSHLAVLSATAALTTASYYTDKKEVDHASNSVNAARFLTDCGFSDVETSKYYGLEEEQHSMGCIAGHKTITVDGKSYTLLAVLPRSAGYKQEWVGNFTVGKGPLHQGFKAARDEILRFVKTYLKKNGIKGDLKVWTTGHSRGGANANMLGGFFAGGGAAYFDDVTLKPENVYCYSFATPTTINTEKTLTKGYELSVEGYRGTENARYKNDSNAAAFTYTGSDANSIVKPQEGVYRAVHNCKPDYDIITYLPPHVWNYTWYGTDLPITDGKSSTKSRMLADLNDFAPFAYKEYVEEDGDEEHFVWKTFDFATLGFVDDEECTEEISQAKMFSQRIHDGLSRRADSADTYVDGGYQDTLRALAAMYGMGLYAFIDGVTEDTETAIKAAAFTFFSYAAERLKAEKGYEEDKAVAYTLEELIEFLTGEEIDPETYKVDDFMKTFMKYIIDNADYYEVEPVVDGDVDDKTDVDTGDYEPPSYKVVKIEFKSKTAEEAFTAISNALIGAIPDEYKEFIRYFIPGFDPEKPMDSEVNRQAISKYVFNTLNQCVYGDGTKENPGTDTDAKRYRENLYGILQFLLPEEYGDIKEAIGYEGEESADDLLDAIMDLLMEDTDEQGGTVRYDSIADAAEAYLVKVIDNGVSGILKDERYERGSVYEQDIIDHGESLKNHVRQLREVVMDLLLYEKDENGDPVPFNAERNIRVASTFISQAHKVRPAHYNELYVAWMMAQEEDEAEELWPLIQDLEKELEELKADNAAQQSEIDSLQKQINELKKDRSESQARIAALEAALEAVKTADQAKIDELEARIAEEQKKIDALEAVVKELAEREADAAAVRAAGAQKVKGFKVRAGKSRATIRWKANKAVSGYEIWRAGSRNGKYKKVKTVKKQAAVKFVNKKLKAKKKYFYKMRTYTAVTLSTGEVKTCCGKWTKVRKAKIK